MYWRHRQCYSTARGWLSLIKKTHNPKDQQEEPLCAGCLSKGALERLELRFAAYCLCKVIEQSFGQFALQYLLKTSWKVALSPSEDGT